MLVGFIVIMLPLIAIVSGVIYVPYALYSKHRFGKQPFLHHFVNYVLVGYCISLIYLTILWYYPDITFFPEIHFLNLRPFVWTQEVYEMGVKKMAEQLILNIGMFVPYGMLLPLVVKKVQKWWKTAMIVLATTVLIETLQYFMGRSADIDDVIMNFIGGILGYFIYFVLNHLFKETKWWQHICGIEVKDGIK